MMRLKVDIKDGFMGEFAEELITDLINYLTYNNDEVISEENTKPKRDWGKQEAEKVINTVDEPFIKERLRNLYDEKYFLNFVIKFQMKFCICIVQLRNAHCFTFE